MTRNETKDGFDEEGNKQGDREEGKLGYLGTRSSEEIKRDESKQRGDYEAVIVEDKRGRGKGWNGRIVVTVPAQTVSDAAVRCGPDFEISMSLGESIGCAR
jgi:hypothetical protein